MDKSKIWAQCLTTTHIGEPCGDDCLIAEYIERQLKQSIFENSGERVE